MDDKAEIVKRKMIDCMKIKCDERQSPLSACFPKHATPLQPSKQIGHMDFRPPSLGYNMQYGRVNALYSMPSIYTDAKYAQTDSWPLKEEDYFSLKPHRGTELIVWLSDYPPNVEYDMENPCPYAFIFVPPTNNYSLKAMPSRTTPVSSGSTIPQPHQMNYYPNSYKANSHYFQQPGSNPLTSTQTTPGSQGPRFYNQQSSRQVMVKPMIRSQGEKVGESSPAVAESEIPKSQKTVVVCSFKEEQEHPAEMAPPISIDKWMMFVILGSANINQRSLKDLRDTGIAMGAYPPCHTWAHKCSIPQGQIKGYRMSLWAEHIGGLESSFERPKSLECVRRVRWLSVSNWNQYAAVEVTDMKAHALAGMEVDNFKMNKLRNQHT
ncbi:phospholipase D gamma 1 [Artemisia annua]|uniref:Phospholipase D gamma 1 n=1 Tax=Artemisia annua TaxID=35608 RepID=A0A2U1LI03_ARTAN|nr:phospholipase D gamma 1 [Artemisia annua]